MPIEQIFNYLLSKANLLGVLCYGTFAYVQITQHNIQVDAIFSLKRILFSNVAICKLTILTDRYYLFCLTFRQYNVIYLLRPLLTVHLDRSQHSIDHYHLIVSLWLTANRSIFNLRENSILFALFSRTVMSTLIARHCNFIAPLIKLMFTLKGKLIMAVDFFERVLFIVF